MYRLLRFGVLGALIVGGTTACFVHTKEVVEKPVPTTTAATCTNAVWVEGHYNADKAWVPGTWTCTRITK